MRPKFGSGGVHLGYPDVFYFHAFWTKQAQSGAFLLYILVFNDVSLIYPVEWFFTAGHDLH